MKITTIIATNKEDQWGDILSEECLEDLAHSAKGKPVSVDFSHVLPNSFIESADIIAGGHLQVEAIINIEPSFFAKFGEFYLVPGYTRDGITGEPRLMEASIVRNPADKNLTPINFNEETRD